MTAYAATHRAGPTCFRMHGGRGHRRHLRGEQTGMSGFLGRGPRASRGDIRAAILALLNEQPMHGYQIMQELAERSGGVWRPSPGSVYPTLQLLQDEALVHGEDAEGGRRLFRLTDEGVAAAAASATDRAPWDAVGATRDEPALELRDLMMGVLNAAREVVHSGQPEQVAQARDVLRDARRRLYRILAEDAEASE
jgi:DNA-binding PadR family transcriptional regulator